MEEVVDHNNEGSQVVPDGSTQSHEEPKTETPDARQAQEERNHRNWTAIRERQKDLEKELRDQREMNQKLLQMASQAIPQQKAEPDELDSISDEDYLTKGKQKKFVNKQMEPLQKQIEDLQRQLQQQQQGQFMVHLKQKYSDFDEVVNPETLAQLEIQEPELANAIADSKDPYKIGVQSYKYIKALGISSQAPEVKRSKEVDKKLAENSKTVQSPLAYEKRPMAEAFRMTDEMKKGLYDEMNKYASQAGFSY